MAKSKKINIDGWQNLLTKLGTIQDKKSYLTFKFPGRMTQDVLNQLYRGDGFAKKIVNIPIYYMLKEWFNIKGDIEGKFQDIYSSIRFRKFLRKHLTWDALHGGSGLVIGLDDGGDLWEPINWNNLKRIKFFKAFSRWEIHTNSTYRDDDMTSDTFGEYIYYDVHPPRGIPFVVHRDRIHILDGEDISNRERHANQEWGDSVLQAPYDQIKRLGSVYSSSESIIEDFIQAVISIENLQQLIATGQEDLVKKRMEILEMSKSVINTLLMDVNEQYEKKASTVTGLDKLLSKFELSLAAVSWIPVTILMGQSPAGMNSTGESDEDAFYDRISFLQGDKPLDAINWINEIIINCDEYDTDIKDGDDPVVEFNPLRQPTQKEIIETRKIQGETDAIYIDKGVLSSEEVRQSRFAGDNYSHDTHIVGTIEPPERNPEPNEEGEEEEDE